MSNYSNPSASWQRRWLDDGWLVLGFKRREPGNHSTTTLTSNVAYRILAVVYAARACRISNRSCSSFRRARLKVATPATRKRV